MIKFKRFLFVFICIVILLIPFGIKVLAIEPLKSTTESANLKAMVYRQGGSESSGTVDSDSYDETSYSYEIGGVDVLKIIQADDEDYSDMLYCVNASGSFPTQENGDNSVSSGFTYENVGDFTDSENEYVKKWKEKVGISEDDYNALIYLLNNIYLMKQNTEYKTTFIKNAFAEILEDEYTIPKIEVEDIMEELTDDDIDVVQQWAIWYFTNGKGSNINSYSNFQSMSVKSSEGESKNISGTRFKYAGILYEYLKKLAEKAVDEGYTASSSKSYPSIGDSDDITSEVEGRYYKVGPFKVTVDEKNIPLDYSLSLEFYNEKETKLEDVTYEIYIDGTKIEDLNSEIFNKEFYIYLPIEDNEVSRIKLSVSYSKREITLWQGSSEENSELQDVVLITEEQVNQDVSVDITEAKYDLALRKYIVSINDSATTGREPVVSGLDELANKTSEDAIYTHSKDPLEVRVGDTVVYEFRVYNEGEVDAESISIVDYIPEGLEVVSGSTINSKYDWQIDNSSVEGYTKVTSTLYTDKNYEIGTVLKAFDGYELDYVTFQIECVVTEDAVNGEILKNIAEIIVDDGADRDSGPGNLTPNPDFTDQEDYENNEDDDDYEQILPVIPKGSYEIKLQKVDQDGEVIASGASFSWTILSGTLEVKKDTGTTSNGELNIGTVEITDIETTDTITITETQAPEGYIALIGSITIEVKKTEADGEYVIDGEPKITSGEKEGVEVSVEGNVITVTVPNEKIEGEYKVILKKVDQDGEVITSGASFSWTILSGTLEVKADTGTTSNGELNIGTVEITDIDTKDTITITETQAPEGYTALIESITIEVNKKEAGGKYVIDGEPKITSGEKEGVEVSVEGNVITVTVPNEKIEGKYEVRLQKVDEEGEIITTSDASFSWTLPGEEEQTNSTSKGELTLGIVEIKDIKTVDEITITETQAPEGYNALIESITIQVRKTEKDGKYIVDEVTIISEEIEIEGEVNLEGNVITIKVPNEKIIYDYDLALRKYIVSINDSATTGREPVVSGLDELANKTSEDAIYTHSKDPLEVRVGDTVVYEFRVYNEGEVDAESITIVDYIPSGLEVIDLTESEINSKYNWQIDNSSVEGYTKVTSTLYTDKNYEIGTVLKAFDGYELDYVTFQIECVVTEDAVNGETLKNIAEITVDDGDDRDSEPDNVTPTPEFTGEEDDDDYEEVVVFIPDGSYELRLQKVDEEGNIITTSEAEFRWILPDGTEETSSTKEGELDLGTVEIEDLENPDEITITEIEAPEGYNALIESITIQVSKTEEDGEYIVDEVTILSEEIEGVEVNLVGNVITIIVPNKPIERNFDLALQKFITGLNDEEVTGREPIVTTDSEGNIVYTNTPDALYVGNGDLVVYTIRIYNEGNTAGYASEITDDIPTGLKFVSDNEINLLYGWEMIDSEGNVTEDEEEAVAVRTAYLSKESSEDNLLEAYDEEVGLSYKDVQIVFQVDESAIDKTVDTEARTIINTAEITGDTDENGEEIDDIDSTPGNGKSDEDDIDQEQVYVKYFDLALEKSLSSALVIVDGVSTRYEVTNDTIRVEVNRKKVSSTSIQFYFTITITNEGEIEGYATEITDYIPDGLYFEASDNPDWTQVSEKEITTNALAKTLLEPGESASVQVILRWEQSSENMGQFINIAEISEDWNEYDSPDIDSTPDNQVPTEDDYDTAPVWVSISTGLLGNGPYLILTSAVLAILATGLVLIKKYVL